MIAGKHPTGTTKSSRDFVCDQQHVVFRAEFADAREVARRSGDHAGGSLHERFDDEAGDLLVLLLQDAFDRIKTGHPTGGVRQPQWTPVAVGRFGGDRGKAQAVESFLEELHAANAHRADGVPVIGQAQMHEGPFGPGLRPVLLPILYRHFQRDFDRGGSIV